MRATAHILMYIMQSVLGRQGKRVAVSNTALTAHVEPLSRQHIRGIQCNFSIVSQPPIIQVFRPRFRCRDLIEHRTASHTHVAAPLLQHPNATQRTHMPHQSSVRSMLSGPRLRIESGCL